MLHSVLIDGRLISYRHGGIANYARQLAYNAPPVASGLRIRLATRHSIPSLTDRSVSVATPAHHRFERLLFGLEVLAHRPSLLHAVDYVQPIAPGVRSVVTVHDLAFLDNPSLVTPDSYRYYSQIKRTLPGADSVIAVSEWTRERLLHHIQIDPGRVRVVSNGYDDSVFGPEPDGEDSDRFVLSRLNPSISAAITGRRPIVLAVGTIEPRKGYDVLLRAFRDFDQLLERASGESPMLVIAGQAGWLSEHSIDQLRALQRCERALWLRDVRDHELAALYRVARLLVMPSLDEGFGLPALEAMASGTPSLVAAVGALPGLVGDAGFVEETTEPSNWAEKIGNILADREMREQRSRRGIERARAYTWRETARKTIEIYREVLND